MSFRNAEFRKWMAERSHTANTISSYASYLNGVEAAIGGLDELLAAEGPAKVFAKLEDAIATGAVINPQDKRPALRKYLDFSEGQPGLGDLPALDDTSSSIEAQTFGFRLEREMQVAVRRQLEAIETGLEAIDGGLEVVLPSGGRTDILARDAKGSTVVIELKAGQCPNSALEQVLSYADELEARDGGTVRPMLIASSFTPRTRAAARRVPGLELRTYDYVLTFNEVGE